MDEHEPAAARVVVRAPPEKVAALLRDFEKWLRFNPVWDELEVLKPLREPEKGRRAVVRLRLEDEKSFRNLEFEVEEASSGGITYVLSDGRRIELRLRSLGDATELCQRGGLSGDAEQEEQEVELWLRALKHYAELRSTPPARLTKLLIDRLLLRLNPMQRRLVMLVLMLQLGLLAISLLAIAVVYLQQALTRA